MAANRVKTRVKDHPVRQPTNVQAGRTNRGTKPDRPNIVERNHVDACRLWIRLSELFRARPSSGTGRLRVYSRVK